MPPAGFQTAVLAKGVTAAPRLRPRGHRGRPPTVPHDTHLFLVMLPSSLREFEQLRDNTLQKRGLVR